MNDDSAIADCATQRSSFLPAERDGAWAGPKAISRSTAVRSSSAC